MTFQSHRRPLGDRMRFGFGENIGSVTKKCAKRFVIGDIG